MYSVLSLLSPSFFFFFFNDTATTEIYTLSLHDALPILRAVARVQRNAHGRRNGQLMAVDLVGLARRLLQLADRKSTRLNSSHTVISYAVFCLKKKKNCEILKRLHVTKQGVHSLVRSYVG